MLLGATAYQRYFKKQTPLQPRRKENHLSVAQESHFPFVIAPLRNISMTLQALFFHVRSIKIAILFFDRAVKSYTLWCSRGYCPVCTFLIVFPVSAPYLSSSFKSIYRSQKSIRLSEKGVDCEDMACCSFTFPFSSSCTHTKTHLHIHTQGKNCDDQGVCASVVGVMTQRKCHTSLEKSNRNLSLFPG